MNTEKQPAVAGPVEPTVRPLLERLREAGADYTVAWGSGDLYDEAADELEDRMERFNRHEKTIRAMVKWLEENQPDVFKRWLWDAINAAAA